MKLVRTALTALLLTACGPTTFEQLDVDGDGQLTANDLDSGECAVVFTDTEGQLRVTRTTDGAVWESTPTIPWFTPGEGFGWLAGAQQTNFRCPLSGGDWSDAYGTLLVGDEASAFAGAFTQLVLSRPEDRSLLNGFKAIDGTLEGSGEASMPVTMTQVDTDNDLFSGSLDVPTVAAFHDYLTDEPTSSTIVIEAIAFREAQQ